MLHLNFLSRILTYHFRRNKLWNSTNEDLKTQVKACQRSTLLKEIDYQLVQEEELISLLTHANLLAII